MTTTQMIAVLTAVFDGDFDAPEKFDDEWPGLDRACAMVSRSRDWAGLDPDLQRSITAVLTDF
jgi:hypothetical protein